MIKKIFISFLLAFIFLLPLGSWAIGFDIPWAADDPGMIGPDDIPATPAEILVSNGYPVGAALYYVVNIIKNIVGAAAIVMIVYNGLVLVSAGSNEEKAKEAKSGTTWALMGLVFMLMMDTVILDVLYGGGGGIVAGGVFDDQSTMQTSLSAGTKNILDIISWLEAIVVISAVFFIVISGFNLVIDFGESDEMETQKKTIQWTAIGLIIMAINKVFVQKVIYPNVLKSDTEVEYSPSAAAGVSEIAAFLKYFLGFLAVLVLVAFVYAGGLMILSFSNEENSEKGKKILKGALIGTVIVLISFAIVATIL